MPRNRGADKLFGGKGDDPLDGGLGRDLCNQGPGRAGKKNCELPGRGMVVAPTPEPKPTPTPTPKVDTDGDGVTDDVDACPDQGDQGYGVDGTGCPNPPPNAFATKCANDDGTYSESPDLVKCDWTNNFPYGDVVTALNAYLPLCFC